MLLYAPATLHSKAVGRSLCLRCGARLTPISGDPEKPSYTWDNFECPLCPTRRVEVISCL
jgi:hypothetical protein